MKNILLVLLSAFFSFITYAQWADRTYKWVPAMEKFQGGALGYDIEKTPEQNEQRYRDRGYSYSFKYSDKQIYTWILGGLVSLFVIIYALKKSKGSRAAILKTHSNQIKTGINTLNMILLSILLLILIGIVYEYCFNSG